mgnify:CR=1 FL=1|tara:strand:+ start:561 stop:1736 length:1176 start_codon:yes stop_codon:yes gene_type:complete
MLKAIQRWWQRRNVIPANDIAKSEQDIEINKQATGEWVAYDENLLERSRTQWQFGDWESLAALSREILQHHPDRAKLALLAAAGHQQQGQISAARQFAQLAQDWGASKKLISQVLIAGVYNTLGRASIIGGYESRALQHFEKAVSTANPNGDLRLFIQARTREEINRVNNNVRISNSLKVLDRKDNDLFSSSSYWEERYKEGGTSGHGSYGRLADFKAEVINNFINDNDIKNAIEFGCGDGNQLSKLKINNYIGIDVSKTIINKCEEKFKNDARKSFLLLNDFIENPSKAELTLSLDVIFHLTEEDIFEDYMHLLLEKSTKYCIIYACDSEPDPSDSEHVLKRKFTKWIEKNHSEWQLTKIVFNKYPHNGEKNPKEHSFSDFYFYKKLNNV